MKIAIVSDCHDEFDNLEKAVEIANQKGCEQLLFAGDFVAPLGLEVFEKFNGKVQMIWGNNEGEKFLFTRTVDSMQNVTMHGDSFSGKVGEIKVFMHHLPEIALLAAKSSEFDLVIHGHTHVFKQEKVGDTLLICPGNLKGWRENAGFVIFDLQKMAVERVEIDQDL